jgi:hypothetical protein
LGHELGVQADTDVGGMAAVPSAEHLLSLAVKRGDAILDLVDESLKVIHRNGRPALVLEMRDTSWRHVSPVEGQLLYKTYSRINDAIADGTIEFTPGYDSLKLIDLEAGLEALAPGLFDPRVVTERLNSTRLLLADVSGQWFPPGIRIDLTKDETTELVALLAAGSALTGFVAALGITGPAGPIAAAALALAAAAVALAQSFSDNGTVALKIIIIPIVPVPLVQVVPIPT